MTGPVADSDKRDWSDDNGKLHNIGRFMGEVGQLSWSTLSGPRLKTTVQISRSTSQICILTSLQYLCTF